MGVAKIIMTNFVARNSWFESQESSPLIFTSSPTFLVIMIL